VENNQIRALCAKITLETNPKSCDALIAELTRVLTGTTLSSKPQTVEGQSWAPAASQAIRKVG
jgi:hypothetical protein